MLSHWSGGKSGHPGDSALDKNDKEVELGRYSALFVPQVLSGMYSMPIHAVPEPGSKKLLLVTDHSDGQFAVNNMISREDIAGVTLDNVQDLGNALRYLRQQEPDVDLILAHANASNLADR